MKKIISIACFSMLLFSSNLFSQSNLTWTVKDKMEGKDYLKTHLTLNTSVSGFANKDEASKFITYLRSNGNISVAEFTNVDANGNGDLKLTVKTPQETMFYLGMAKKLNVGTIVANGVSKTTDALIMEERQKSK